MATRSQDASVRGLDVNVKLTNGVPTITNYVPRTFSARKEIAGSSCPGYKTLIAEGKDATTPLSAKDTRVLLARPARSKIVYQASPGGSFYELHSTASGIQYIPGVTIPGDLIANAQQAVRSKFYGLYETGPSTDLGIVAAELASVISMINNPYSKLVKHVSKRFTQARVLGDRISRSPRLKRLPRQRRIVEARKQWNAAYLETYFGWLPFISDIRGMMADLEKLLTKPPLVQVNVTGGADSLTSAKGTLNFQGIAMTTSRQSKHVYSQRYRGAYHAALSLDTEFTVPTDWKTELMPALFEAIPYSWLSDYVFNTGSVLAAEQSAQSLEWAWLCYTSRYTRRDAITIVPSSTLEPSWVKTDESRPGFLIVEHKLIDRSPATMILPPSHGLRHKPNTRLAALGAVASVVSQRADNLKDRKRFMSQLLSH